MRGERLCSHRAGGDWLGILPDIRLRLRDGLSDLSMFDPDKPEPDGPSESEPTLPAPKADADVDGPLLAY